MNKNEAFAAARRMAEKCDVDLSRYLWSRHLRWEPKPNDWALLFIGLGCPRGWTWLAIVNDYGDDDVLVAIKRQLARRTRMAYPLVGNADLGL